MDQSESALAAVLSTTRPVLAWSSEFVTLTEVGPNLGAQTRPFAGAATSTVFRDAQLWVPKVGGDAFDLAKMTTRAVFAEGKSWQVHWVENLATGSRTGFKWRPQ